MTSTLPSRRWSLHALFGREGKLSQSGIFLSDGPIQIALRTYALSLTLSLGPALLPFLTSPFSRAGKSTALSKSQRIAAIARVLRRELSINGFAFAITVAAGGGVALARLWEAVSKYLGGPTSAPRPRHCLDMARIKNSQKLFISNIISSTLARYLLRSTRDQPYHKRVIPIPLTLPISDTSLSNHVSPTLDFTLLLLVRAADALVQSLVVKKVGRLATKSDTIENMHEKLDQELTIRIDARERRKTVSQIDAIVFWVCSARIMWCFFYKPQRLPQSYVNWITRLANVDYRLLHVIRALRSRHWSYSTGSPTHSHLLTTLSQDLGYPASWGHPALLPAYGGRTADAAWLGLGVRGRRGIGGLPCELVHGALGTSSALGGGCTANFAVRFGRAFLQAIAIYIPAHFVPILLTRPHVVMRWQVVASSLLASLRSAAFLSSFISSFWLIVCFVRTLIFARLFPRISHNFWDGPYGCVFAGCFMCGTSIWIENGRRRGEMALYVLPRALRASLPDKWVRSGNILTNMAERVAFIVSLASLLTVAVHQPDSLRGLSRWTLAFVMNGPNAGFWKRKQQSPVPSVPSTPTPSSSS